MRRTHGVTNIDTAKLCFEENLALFGSTTGSGVEKFNLYTGLYKLSAAVEELQAEVRQLKAEIVRLSRS